MKRYSIIVLIFLTSFSLRSQFAEDALRLSQNYYQGTARTMAIGGAIGSIGADFSSASINPAGMGLFRKGVFSITPEVASTTVSSMYNGMLTDDNRTIFNLSNFGYVVSKPLSSDDGWKFFQFGFGMNRLNNYNSAIYIQGENTVSSKLDAYVDLADGLYYDQLEEYDPYELFPAWYLYLIDTIPGYENLYYNAAVPFGGVLQQQSIISKGSTNEWLFSFSGNYNEKLFIGATIGLPYTRYYRESTYAEFDVNDTIPFFDNWTTTETLSTTGWGINLKLGLIFRPLDWLRIGGAFHTPTYYWSLQDNWQTTTTVDYDGIYDSYKSLLGDYEYSLSTPLRALGSAGVIIAQRAFVSFDYEYADYSTARFSSRSFSYPETNGDIKKYYQATHNFRGGVEYRYSNFSFRGGYALYASPYANNINDGQRTMISGGIGYRTALFALDFAYVHSSMSEDYYLYTTENITSNAAVNDYKGQSFVMSLRYFLD